MGARRRRWGTGRLDSGPPPDQPGADRAPQRPGLDLIAWHRTTARGRSHGVGELDPNAWGLVDTLGNVGEWVWDIYDPNYGAFQPGRNPQTDPLGAEFGDTRTIRGCGWDTGNIFCRLAARETDFGAKHWNQLGFRPARSIQ